MKEKKMRRKERRAEEREEKLEKGRGKKQMIGERRIWQVNSKKRMICNLKKKPEERRF